MAGDMELMIVIATCLAGVGLVEYFGEYIDKWNE
jgi:hypothetical protein